MAENKAGPLMDAYVKLRDAKSKLQARHKAELAPINQMLERIEKDLLAFLDEQGTTSTSTPTRTAFIDPKVTYKIEDWPALQEFINSLPEDQRFSYLDRRPSKSAIEAFLEDNGALPPGITASTFRKVAIRRK